MNQKNIIAALGIAVVILIGTTVYFATIDKVSQPVVPAPKVVQQPAPTPAPATQSAVSQSATPSVTSETDNWKMYVSSDFGISLKYPNNWFTKEDKSDNRIYIRNVNFKEDVNKGNAPSDFQQIWISTLTQEASLQTENNTKRGKPDCCDVVGAVSSSTIISDGIVINTYEYETAGGSALQAFWTDKNGKRYSATNSTEVGEMNQKNMTENLKKILSTIKFTK